MNATVENSPVFLDNDNKDYSMLVAFNNILEDVTRAKNEEELKRFMDCSFHNNSRYFKIGFGSNHMWVTQKCIKNDVEINNEVRIIIVNF